MDETPSLYGGKTCTLDQLLSLPKEPHSFSAGLRAYLDLPSISGKKMAKLTGEFEESELSHFANGSGPMTRVDAKNPVCAFISLLLLRKFSVLENVILMTMLLVEFLSFSTTIKLHSSIFQEIILRWLLTTMSFLIWAYSSILL